MSLLDIRKIIVQLEEVHKEMDKPILPASRKVTVAAVINNPYAGKYVEDLEPLYDPGREIGGLLAERGVQALGVNPDDVEAYGKGAIIGLDGEIEHAAAVMHPRCAQAGRNGDSCGAGDWRSSITPHQKRRLGVSNHSFMFCPYPLGHLYEHSIGVDGFTN